MTSQAMIFIPGIKGTNLVNTNLPQWDTIWSALGHSFEDLNDLAVSYDDQGNYFDQHSDVIIQPGQTEHLVYREFIRDLKTDKPVYIFHYDWRFSAQVNGRRLIEFMNYLTAKSKANPQQADIKRFDFVTHSLGNIILRYVIKQEAMARIHKVVFAVPAFTGSLDIVISALIGEGLHKGVKGSIRKLIRTMPGALELLPSYIGASQYDNGDQHDFFNFATWQSNVTDQFATKDNKMAKALAIAKDTIDNHLSDFSELSAQERDRILVLASDGEATWQSVPIKSSHMGLKNYVDFDGGIQTVAGDGRVPHISACCFCETINTYVIKKSLWYVDFPHGMFLKDERAQKLINRFLFLENSFDAFIPGGSVEKVVAMEKQINEEQGTHWFIKTQSVVKQTKAKEATPLMF